MSASSGVLGRVFMVLLRSLQPCVPRISFSPTAAEGSGSGAGQRQVTHYAMSTGPCWCGAEEKAVQSASVSEPKCNTPDRIAVQKLCNDVRVSTFASSFSSRMHEPQSAVSTRKGTRRMCVRAARNPSQHDPGNFHPAAQIFRRGRPLRLVDLRHAAA